MRSEDDIRMRLEQAREMQAQTGTSIIGRPTNATAGVVADVLEWVLDGDDTGLNSGGKDE